MRKKTKMIKVTCSCSLIPKSKRTDEEGKKRKGIKKIRNFKQYRHHSRRGGVENKSRDRCEEGRPSRLLLGGGIGTAVVDSVVERRRG